jgi:ubiquinone/menaquinone biosynthesis C-methylase UbiE
MKPGDRFFDVGAGTDYFSFPAREIVGDGGLVAAIDSSTEMIRILKERALELSGRNIIVRKTEENSFGPGDMKFDLVLVSLVLHEVHDINRFPRELMHFLESGYSAAVIDWIKSDTDREPPVEDRIERDEASSYLEKAGLTLDIKTDYNAYFYINIAKNR